MLSGPGRHRISLGFWGFLLLLTLQKEGAAALRWHGKQPWLARQHQQRSLLSSGRHAHERTPQSLPADAAVPPATVPTAGNSAKAAAGSNGTTANTTSAQQSSLEQIEDKVKQDLDDLIEERHSKATIAAAATIGSLLLLSMVGCAGFLVYRRFTASRHAASTKRHKADPAQKYYDADRVFGDAPDL